MEYVSKTQVKTPLYDAMEEMSKLYNEYNDCSVKAVAVVCGVSYADARKALAKFGRKNKCAASDKSIFSAVDSFNKSVYFDYHFIDDRIQKLHSKNYVVKNLTTRQMTMFPELVGEGTWLAFTNGHVLAIKNGQVHCWAARYALHIKSVYKIGDK